MNKQYAYNDIVAIVLSFVTLAFVIGYSRSLWPYLFIASLLTTLLAIYFILREHLPNKIKNTMWEVVIHLTAWALLLLFLWHVAGVFQYMPWVNNK